MFLVVMSLMSFRLENGVVLIVRMVHSVVVSVGAHLHSWSVAIVFISARVKFISVFLLQMRRRSFFGVNRVLILVDHIQWSLWKGLHCPGEDIHWVLVVNVEVVSAVVQKRSQDFFVSWTVFGPVDIFLGQKSQNQGGPSQSDTNPEDIFVIHFLLQVNREEVNQKELRGVQPL